ncbi:hypothetical protein [Brucella cytisi]|uniref:hypothetical protein n=1 Tax=Brucella cytisi TaxID=407152 RepID=UPI00142DB647|nr:hypothetical protein [Brucella cytisi]
MKSGKPIWETTVELFTHGVNVFESRLPQSGIVINSNLPSFNESLLNLDGTEFENGDEAAGHSGK